MRWPLDVPDELSTERVSVRRYQSDDASHLFLALSDDRVWEHIPRAVPTTALELDAVIRSGLATGNRITFTIREGGEIVGVTSFIFDPADPEGVEIGATQLSTSVWGTGVNGAAKRLLISLAFDQGAAWIQFRTDERNARSAAAIAKLGADDLGTRQDTLVRRDGSLRRSWFFRLRPSSWRPLQ
ncbi:MAG: GNAT family protein [Pseudolysinimonas sp.]